MQTVGMVLLDIIAPILLMIGVSIGTSSNASLLGNFEIVATTVIALLVFQEAVSKRLWLAVGFITLSSMILSFDSGSIEFSLGSLIVALFLGEEKPELQYIILTLILGFVAYGLSIFTYIRAQKHWERQKQALTMQLLHL